MRSGFARRLVLILALLSLVSLAACGRPGAPTGGTAGSSGDGKTYEMKVATATAKDAQNEVADYFAQQVTELSKGRIKATVYNASQLGNNEKMNKDVRSGALEALVQPTGFMAPYVPALGVLDLPFLFPDDDGLQTKVLNSDATKPLQDEAKKAGVEVVTWFGGGFKDFVTRFPVNKAADLKNRKIRVIQSPELVGQYKAWGSIPIPMALGELYTAIQQGTVEGFEIVPDIIAKMKFYEVAPYVSISHHGALSSVVIVSTSFMDSLPADLQKVVREAGQKSADKALEFFTKARADGMKVLEAEKSVKITPLPQAEKDKLKADSKQVWDDIRKDAAKAPALAALEKGIANVK